MLLDGALPLRVQDLESSSDHVLGVGTWWVGGHMKLKGSGGT